METIALLGWITDPPSHINRPSQRLVAQVVTSVITTMRILCYSDSAAACPPVVHSGSRTCSNTKSTRRGSNHPPLWQKTPRSIFRCLPTFNLTLSSPTSPLRHLQIWPSTCSSWSLFCATKGLIQRFSVPRRALAKLFCLISAFCFSYVTPQFTNQYSTTRQFWKPYVQSFTLSLKKNSSMKGPRFIY